jgi:hypothetical protein
LASRIKLDYTGSYWIILDQIGSNLEFVTGGVELLRAVLHGYAGGLIFMKIKKKKKKIVFQKENGNTFTLLIIIIVKSLQKEQIAQIYYYDP